MSTTTSSRARIEFLFFSGCPNAAATLENLRSAVAALGMDPDAVTRVEVQPESNDRPFPGSPSILVDGVDIYTGSRPETSDFSCRIFDFAGERTGIMPEEFIRRRLAEIISGERPSHGSRAD